MHAPRVDGANPVLHRVGLRNRRGEIVLGRNANDRGDVREIVRAQIVEERMPDVGVVKRAERRCSGRRVGGSTTAARLERIGQHERRARLLWRLHPQNAAAEHMVDRLGRRS